MQKFVSHMVSKEMIGDKLIPSETIAYYTIEKSKGNRFGLFPYIPHILSLGEVGITDVEVITWNESP